MCHHIDLVGGDPRSDGLSSAEQHFRGHRAGESKPLEGLNVLELSSFWGAGVSDLHIVGAGDRVWHESFRRHGSKLHPRTLKKLSIAVAPLELSR